MPHTFLAQEGTQKRRRVESGIPDPIGPRFEALALGALLLGMVSLGCGPDAGSSGPQPARELAAPWTAPPSAAGAEACRDCHAAIVESWSHTGMARSLGAVDASEVRDLGGATDAAAGFHYDFAVEKGLAAIIETHPEAPDHRLAVPLIYAIGSGERDRSYVAAQGALQFFAPLEALASEAGRLPQLPPQHMVEAGTRFSSPITAECLGCHTDSLPARSYPLELRPDPRQWRPRGISCAGCHAATGEHLAHQEAELGGAGAEGADPILRHSRLSRIERLSVCAACHLAGDARIVLDAGRLGPPEPGGDLLQQRAIFVGAETTEEVGFVSHVERLVASACFTQSADLVCGTCHDPHRTLHEERERLRVRRACLQCHPAAMDHGGGAASAPACTRAPSEAMPDRDCVACHMPLRPVFDLAGVEIHDHFIRTRPGPARPAPEVRLAESLEADWRRFVWPGVPPPEHVDDPGLLMMAYHSDRHAGRALELVDRPVGPRVAALPMYHHVRGVLLESAGRREEAVAAYERALSLDPEEAVSATNLGLLLGELGRAEEGLETLNRVLAKHPMAEGAYRNRALLAYGKGNLGAFAADLARAFELWPRSGLADTLASFFDSVGEPARAAQWRRVSASLTPRPR